MFLRRSRIALVLFVLLSVVGTASARQYLQADVCTIGADEVITGTVFVLCQDLIINGTLEGNLIGAATNTIINGEVTDSVYLMGGEFDLFGTLGDDLHYLGVVLNIHSSAEFESPNADIFSLMMSTVIEPETILSGSVSAIGYQMIAAGSVGGEFNFWGSALELDGDVGGDLNANVGDSEEVEGTAQLETLFLPFPIEIDFIDPGLRLANAAFVGGNLTYTAPNERVRSGSVAGDERFNQITNQFEPPTDEESWRQSIQQYFANSIREFVTLAVVGALGLLFSPNLTVAPLRNLRRRPLTSLGVGTLTFILSFPVVFFALFVSVLIIFSLSLLQAGNLIFAGAVVLLILDVGGAGLFYFTAIFVARSVFCIAIGRQIMRFIIEDDDSTRFLYVSLLAGSLLIAFLVSLPVIGWVPNALTLFLGLGAIVNLLQAYLRNLRESPTFATAGGVYTGDGRQVSSSIRVEKPTLPESTPSQRARHPRPRHTVGLDDLPPGFVWWDEE